MLGHIIKHITFKRALNLAKIFLSYSLSNITGRVHVWGMPATFSVEPTNYCNLKCPECPSGTGQLTRAKGFMQLEDFKRIIDDISGHCFYVQLFFQGEPYLNKQLSRMTQYAQSRGMFVSVSTNGLAINEKNIEQIFENPPDHLIFSLDGLDEETYQRYRVGGSFQKAEESLKLITEWKKKKSSVYPIVELQFLVMKQNEHQMTQLKQLARKTGADRVAFKSMQVYSYEDALLYLPENEKFRRYTVNNGELRIKKKLKNQCLALWRTSVITWDGIVTPCCFDKDARFRLGDTKTDSFEEIWKSVTYNSFRKRILTGRSRINMCNNCSN